MKDRRVDSQELCPILIPYDTRPSPPDDQYRLFSTDHDTYITAGGNIKKRPGIQKLTSNNLSGRTIRKLWLYTTIPNTSGIQYSYWIASTYDPTLSATTPFKLYYCTAAGSAWTSCGTLRDLDASTRVHELVTFKGKCYVKSFPASGGNKLGTVIMDGSTGSIVLTPWGLLPPATPAKISGHVTKLNGAMDASGVGVINVDSSAGFSTSYPLQIGAESITFTTIPGGGTTFGGTVTRGANGTTGEKHGDNTIVLQRDWAASDHQVDVTQGWYYSYAYVNKCTDSSTPTKGQISSRAPLQTNPDLMPSFTGPFRDLVPKIIIQGNADTTNIPYINIYRTKNGGGTFFFLEQITNTGAGDITYYDDSFGTGGSSSTYNDPVPDDVLDGENRKFGPSTVSNDPPPTVEDPLVTGTDTPSKLCFGMTTYAGRIWVAIGKTLYYSSREELIAGINEESFKSGSAGNFIPFGELIVGLVTTATGLFVLTTHRLAQITGITRDTFTDVQIASIGGMLPDVLYGNRNIIPVQEDIAFISSDNSVVLYQDNKVRTISDPVINYYLNQIGITPGDITYLRNAEYEVLILSSNNFDSGVSDSRSDWFIYDMRKSRAMNIDFWWSPWQTLTGCIIGVNDTIKGIYSSTVCTSPGSVFSTLTKMNSLSVSSSGSFYDSYVNTSGGANIASNNYGAQFTFTTLRAPVGNNLNRENRPARNVELEAILVHYNTNQSFTTPTPVFLGDNNSSIVTATAADPPRIEFDNSSGETIYYYPFNNNCYRAKLSFTSGSSANGFEIYRLVTLWDIAGGIE